MHTAGEQDESVIVMWSASMLRGPVPSARVLGSSEIAGLAITTDCYPSAHEVLPTRDNMRLAHAAALPSGHLDVACSWSRDIRVVYLVSCGGILVREAFVNI